MTRSEAESLTQRIRDAAAREGIPAARLRSRIVLQRLLAYLANSEDCVLQGGFSLLVRLGLIARVMKNHDLLRREPMLAGPSDPHDVLDDELERDWDDWFDFRGRLPNLTREDGEPSIPGAIVEVHCAGADYGVATIEVAALPVSADRFDGVDQFRNARPVAGGTFDVKTFDVHRRAAERSRPVRASTPHLVVLVLLDSRGLLGDARLGLRLAPYSRPSVSGAPIGLATGRRPSRRSSPRPLPRFGRSGSHKTP